MVLGAINSVSGAAPGAKGAAADTMIFQVFTTDQAGPALQAGTIDAYDFALTATQAAALQGTPGIAFERAPSAFDDLILNPAPVFIGNLTGDQTSSSRSTLAAKFNAPVGAVTSVYYDSKLKLTFVEFGAYAGKGLNPFAFKPVRVAMNYEIDRNTIVSTIFRGSAVPMYAYLSSFDPTFTSVADLILKYKFSYNPAQTAQALSDTLTAAGAVFSGGSWTYGGQPITLNYIIRIEDQRKDMGDQFAAASENLGFKINRIYLTFGPALNIAQGTDPKLFQWHLYTEGFSKNSITKWDRAGVSQFYAPWFGQMPGRGNTAWYNYQNSTIDALTTRIYNGNYTSQDEYVKLYRQATEMGIQESMRVFQITQLTTYPVSTLLQGVTNDAGAGLRAIFNTREWNVPGKTTVNVGVLHVYTTTTNWNPVGGFGDIYSVDPARGTYDTWTAQDPFSGLPIPFRAPFDVQTAGPLGKLSVPTDAFNWNATTGSWNFVRSGSQATSKVTFDLSNFLGTKFHDGTKFTYGDVLANIAQTYDIAFNSTRASLETSISASTRNSVANLVGFKILNTTSKFEVYLNYWHFSPNYIAAAASQGFLNPYSLVLAEDQLVFNQKTYAYSQSASRSRSVPWMNPVLSGHASDIAAALQTFVNNNYFPAKRFTVGSTVYATAAESVARYQAAISWITAHQHAWISDGPFYLDTFSAQGDTLTLKAWRDSTYPFSPGKWVRGEPPLVTIQNVGIPTVNKGQSASLLVDLNGPPPLHVKYILRDSVKGNILSVGDGSLASGSRFIINLVPSLTGTLNATFPYEITILAYSDAAASIDSTTRFVSVFDPTVITNPLQQQIQQSIAASNAIAQTLNKTLGAAVSQAFGQTSSAITALGTKADSLGTKIDNLATSVNSAATTSANQQSQSATTLTYLVAALAVLQLVTIGTVFAFRRR